MVKEQAYYDKGYKKAISDTHAWRTVDNAVSYVIPYVKPDFKVLDVGSGPGTITVDFGVNYLTEGGSIIGVEPTQEVLDAAEAYKKKYATEQDKNVDNVFFQKGSIYELPFEDNTFDLVHAHQVTLHLEDPVAGLKELRRVTKPGGYVCVKDGDMETSVVYPEKYQLLRDFLVLKAKSSGYTDSQAGRKLRSRAIEAGYVPSNIKLTMSNWILGNDQRIKGLYRDMIVTRAKSGGEQIYPDDPEKDEQVKAQFVELLNEFTDDETSLQVNSNQAYYGKGYKKVISDTHAWRTVDNAVAYVIPYVKPNFKVLDVGSGPGTITVDFGVNYLTEGGSIIGVEPTQEVIDTAEEYKKKYASENNKNVDNISFQKGSIYKLPFEDNTFDLVHAHQVSLHLQDPVTAFKELKRVAKPGGFVCVKDSDFESRVYYPEKYQTLSDLHIIKANNSGYTDSQAGRKLRGRAIDAGYEPNNIKLSVSTRILGDNLSIKQAFVKRAINRLKTSGEEIYPNDPEKNEQAKAKSIELSTEFMNDESSFQVNLNFEIVYQKTF
ncbi:hypothetical protein JA1_004462 [Spathaspora sp. JA1]|nr:hypothetical protein JA1_004462 [Spathaspora sp. JA1]